MVECDRNEIWCIRISFSVSKIYSVVSDADISGMADRKRKMIGVVNLMMVLSFRARREVSPLGGKRSEMEKSFLKLIH